MEKQFGSIAPGPEPRRVRTVEPEQLGERRVEVSREGTTAYLKLAYHAPAVGDPDFFPMLVLDAILSGAKGINLWSSFRTPPPQRSARLYRALVERRLASSVGAGLLPTEHPFLYLISATAMEGVSRADVEAAATATLEDVAKNGVTDREVVKARNQLRARLVFENDSVTNLGHQLGYFETVASREIYQSAPARIADVPQADVERVAAKYLDSDRRTVGWFNPPNGDEALTTVAPRGLAASRTVLENGTVIISKEAHTVPAVTIQLSVRAGSIYESDELLGLSHLTSRVLDRGTRARSSDEIAEALDARGVSLSVTANRHVLTVSCTCLSEDFEAMLELIGELVMQPAFPDEEIEKRKGEVLNAIRQDEDNPAATAMQSLFAMLYPNHPYGRPAKGNVDSVGRIRRDDLVSFHEARFAPSTATAIIVGDVDRERAVATGARVLGGWRQTRTTRDHAGAPITGIERARSA